MATKNRINSNFYQIAIADSNGNVDGVQANYFSGDGANLSNIAADSLNADIANITITGGNAGQYLQTDGSGVLSWADAGNATALINGNSNVIVEANGNVSTSSGGNANVFVVTPNGVYTTGTSNVTGDLNVGGNAIITGNLIVNGNTNYINVNQLQVESPLIEMGGGPNGAPLTTNDGKDRGSWLHVFDTVANAQVDKFMGWDNSNAEFAFGSNVTVANSVATINEFGNVRANNFIGNLSGRATSAGAVNINATNTGANFNVMFTGSSGGASPATPWVEADANTFVYNPNTNTLFATNANISGVSNLGAVGNVKITGGSNGQYLRTDGTGNLSWANVSGGNTVTTYVNASRTGTSQVVTAIPTTVLWNSTVGGGIPYNPATGEFTLTAGVTYQLFSEMQQDGSVGATFMDYQWYNVTAGTTIGTGGSCESLNASTQWSTGQPAHAVITPSVTTLVSVRILGKGTGNGGVRAGFSFAQINQLGTSAAATTTAPTYFYGTWSTGFSAPAFGQNWKPTTTQAVGIPYDSANGYWTLTGGKTYRLEAQLSSSTGGTDYAVKYHTVSGNTAIGITSAEVWGGFYPATTGYVTIYQPSVDTQIKLMTVYAGGAIPVMNQTFSHVAITEIGSTTGLPAGPTIVTQPLTIGATTTAPTKATTREEDYITIVDDGSGWVSCNFQYAAQNGSGATGGSGFYLYSLPGGYSFNTTVHPIDNTLTNIASWDRIYKIIPGSTGIISFNNSGSVLAIVPYSATQFRIITTQYIAGAGHQTWWFQSNVYYTFASTYMNVGGTFRFKKA